MSFADKNRNFLRKMRTLPEHHKKIILWTIVAIFAVGLGFFWVKGAINSFVKISQSAQNIALPELDVPAIPSLEQITTSDNANPTTSQTADWKTYTNIDYNFQVEYPPDWTFHDYKTGAAFSPKIEGTGNGAINVGFYARGSAYCKIPFADYVKIAGPSEIQNYQSLNTINGGTNNNGVQAYETTWNYNDLDGNGKISLPITYFEAKPELCGNFEAFLNDNNYSDTYNTIISTFNFIK